MNLETVPQKYRVGFGLTGALVIAGLITVVLAYGQGYFQGGYELTAVFPTSSQGLFTDGGSAVKMRGLNVGEVSGIELLDDGRAEVTLFIHDGIKVPDTAMASIEPLSIFGPKFVRLEPGDGEATGPYLADGDEIDETQTQRELTDILAATTNLFEHVDPMDIIVTVDAIAEGVAGLGPEIGSAIDASGALAAVAAAHEDDIRRFLADAALLSETFAAHSDDMISIGQDVEELVEAGLGDPDAVEDLLDATNRISTTFAKLLSDNEGSLDVTLRSLGQFINDVSIEGDRVPEMLDMLGTFFGRLSDIIRMPAPKGKQMGALRGFMSLDLCLVYGICLPGSNSAGTQAAGASPVDVSAAGAAGVTPAQVAEARALRALRDANPPEGALVDFARHLIGGTR